MRKRSHFEPTDRLTTLRRRAARQLKQGDARKAALTLRDAIALDPSGVNYVRLGHALTRAGKRGDAVLALKQALFLFRHEDMRPRARTVARLILKLDPNDSAAQRRAA